MMVQVNQTGAHSYVSRESDQCFHYYKISREKNLNQNIKFSTLEFVHKVREFVASVYGDGTG